MVSKNSFIKDVELVRLVCSARACACGIPPSDRTVKMRSAGLSAHGDCYLGASKHSPLSSQRRKASGGRMCVPDGMHKIRRTSFNACIKGELWFTGTGDGRRAGY
jgi:hypothetical protein